MIKIIQAKNLNKPELSVNKAIREKNKNIIFDLNKTEDIFKLKKALPLCKKYSFGIIGAKLNYDTNIKKASHLTLGNLNVICPDPILRDLLKNFNYFSVDLGKIQKGFSNKLDWLNEIIETISDLAESEIYLELKLKTKQDTSLLNLGDKLDGILGSFIADRFMFNFDNMKNFNYGDLKYLINIVVSNKCWPIITFNNEKGNIPSFFEKYRLCNYIV